MLHIETVEPDTLALLKELLAIPEMKDFCLVGGTALSLMYGHRVSIDLDLFSKEKFDNLILEGVLRKRYRADYMSEDKASFFGLFAYIKNVKVDIVRFPHPIIRPTQTIDGIRMYAAEDIVAMKVQAVLGRGKKKDFWDIAELLKHFSVGDFVALHKEKYSTQNLLITVPQAITYFDDANQDADPISLNGQSWGEIKSFIKEKVDNYLR